MRQIFYFITKSLQNLRHFSLINFITIGIIGLSLLVLSVFLMVFLNLQTYLHKWKDQIQVSAYLADQVTAKQTDSIKEKIKSFSQVKSLSFFSKEEAASFFQDNFPEQKQTLESLKQNPFPASIDIRLKDKYREPEEVKKFALQIEKITGVEGVEYGQAWLEEYTRFFKFIRSAALAVGVVILLATIFIVSNTIGLTIFTRKEEIQIMRLVGATNFFIRMPFFLEGIIQGFLGALLALLTLYGCYHLFINWIAQSPYFSLEVIQVSFFPSSYVLFILAGGMATGFLGSFFSLGRYLRHE